MLLPELQIRALTLLENTLKDLANKYGASVRLSKSRYYTRNSSCSLICADRRKIKKYQAFLDYLKPKIWMRLVPKDFEIPSYLSSFYRRKLEEENKEKYLLFSSSNNQREVIENCINLIKELGADATCIEHDLRLL